MVIYLEGKRVYVDKIVVIILLVYHVAYGLEEGHWYETSICTKRGMCEHC